MYGKVLVIWFTPNANSQDLCAEAVEIESVSNQTDRHHQKNEKKRTKTQFKLKS